MLSWQALAALGAVAAVAGFVDAIAGGGGLLTVPALLWAGLPPQLALGTNKLQSCCGTALAAWRYRKARLIDTPGVRWVAAVTFAAAIAGAATVSRLSSAGLQKIIPVLLLAMAVLLAVRRDLGTRPGVARWSPLMFGLVFGSALGFYDGFFGPGTGTFWTIAGIGLLGFDYPRATAYTKVMNLASNLGALLIFLKLGQVDWQVGAVMAAGQMAGARLGSGMVIRNGSRIVRPVFLVVVMAVAVRLAWKAYRGG
ncbi:MAG TPA: TSUP family transporter [Candidatus Limnocylindria bacterium]|jgi:uncharacterized membrane protein YfcA|nr:TSUP family transporter [Candidatus Limnocylindria bacterium]